MGALYDRVSLDFLTLRVLHTKPPAIGKYSFFFPFQHGSHGGFCSWVSARKPRIPVFVCFSNFEGCSFPCVFLSLIDPRRMLIFQSVHLFTCYWNGVVTSKLLACITGNWKSSVIFQNIFSASFNNICLSQITIPHMSSSLILPYGSLKFCLLCF